VAKDIRNTLENPKKEVLLHDFHDRSLQLSEERAANKVKGRNRRNEPKDVSLPTSVECPDIANLGLGHHFFCCLFHNYLNRSSEPDIVRFKEEIEAVPLECWK